jgi:hypothetical protein
MSVNAGDDIGSSIDEYIEDKKVHCGTVNKNVHFVTVNKKKYIKCTWTYHN